MEQKNLKILVTGDNGECLPPPYGGIMKRCLLHARMWREMGAEVFIHIHHYHSDENDLDAKATYFYDFSKKPEFFDRILFLVKNFLSSPIIFLKLFFLAKKLFPNFDLTFFSYCAGRGIVLKRAIKRYKPDVVVVETSLLQSAVAVYLAKKFNLPVVLENYAEIQYKAKDGGPNLAVRYEKLWKYVLNNADLVVPASLHCAKGPRMYLGDSSKIHVVYSGINFDVFFGRMLSSQKEARQKFNLPADKFLVMAVGALKMRKGHDHLFEAMLLLPEDVRQRMAVVLCGMGDIPELKAKARELGFPDESLKVFQGLSESDLAELYSAVDCFCFPSITPRECMGMAMKEAMAIGLPVAAYDTGGISEAIENGVNGILVPTGDKAALAAAVQSLSKISDEEKAKYRKNNSEKARALFDIKKTSKDLLEEIKKVVGKNN